MTGVSTAVSCKIRNKLHNSITQEGRARAHLQLDQSKTKTQEYKQPSVQCPGLIIFWTPKTLGSSISLALPCVACLVGLGWLCSLSADVPGGHHKVPASPIPWGPCCNWDCTFSNSFSWPQLLLQASSKPTALMPLTPVMCGRALHIYKFGCHMEMQLLTPLGLFIMTLKQYYPEYLTSMLLISS